MSILRKYAKSSKLMNLALEFNGEKIKFNLYKELAIKKASITNEAIEQSQSYGFLVMLLKRLIKKVNDLEVEQEKIFSERFIYYLTSTKSSYYKAQGRYPAQDTSKHLATKDELYYQACLKLNQAKEKKDLIESAVKAFEQRASMIQTISANERKEKA